MKLKVEDSEKQVNLSDNLANKPLNMNLLSQAVRRILANRRQGNAHSKNRGEVSGGGRKPWKQKGRGSARAGSSRSPIWIGGGVSFGPRNVRNYKERLNRKMRQAVMEMLIAEKIRQKKFIVSSELKLPKVGTKQMQAYLEKLPIEEGRILIVLSKTNVNIELSSANLSYLSSRLASHLDILDLIKADYLLTDIEGIKALESLFSKKSPEAEVNVEKTAPLKPKAIGKVKQSPPGLKKSNELAGKNNVKK